MGYLVRRFFTTGSQGNVPIHMFMTSAVYLEVSQGTDSIYLFIFNFAQERERSGAAVCLFLTALEAASPLKTYGNVALDFLFLFFFWGGVSSESSMLLLRGFISLYCRYIFFLV